MAAGALTGALFKSTGEQFSCSLARSRTLSHRVSSVPSWGEACLGDSDCGLGLCGGLELGKDARLSYIIRCVIA